MKIKQTFRLHFPCSRSGSATRRVGFTLIELIIVIAIIALLAAATFVAVNPAKRIGDANNAQRWSDASAIIDAWNLYLADNNGTQATSLTSGVHYIIATTTGGTFSNTHCSATSSATGQLADLSALVTGGYIGQIPTDSAWTYADADMHTQYYMYYDSTSGATKVGACTTYNSANIEVIR